MKKPKTGNSLASPKLRIIGLVMSINIALAMAAAAWLDYSKTRYHEVAALNSRNIGRVLEISVTATLQRIDQTLHTLASEPARCAAQGLPRCEALAHLLENRQLTRIDALAFFVADAKGRVLSSQPDLLSAGRTTGDISDRGYFQKFKANPAAGLLISAPHIGRITGRWVISLARPIVAADGRFLGVVLASLELEALQKMLSAIDLGAHGAFSLRDANMGVILRFPEPKGIGTNIGATNVSPQLAQMLEKKMTAGTYRAVTPLDGIERTVSFTRSSVYPLHINVGLSAEDYLGRWQNERGMMLWVLLTLFGLTSLAGWLFWRMYRLQIIEIAQRRRAEESLGLAASVFAHSQEGIIVADAERNIIDVNCAFTHLTGYEHEEVIGKNPRLLSSGLHPPEFYTALWDTVRRAGSWQGEIWDRRKTGEKFAALLSIDRICDNSGAVQHYVGVFSDISQMKAHEAELNRIAHYDPLTGLPNRRLLTDRLQQAVGRARRNSEPMAVCYMDIDGFKPVNDQFGHAVGDRILIEIAARLLPILRGVDTVARLGGDEFVLLFNGMADRDECETVLNRILAAVAQAIDLDGTPIGVSASIGVAIFPDDDTDPDTLLRHADQAMYLAKEGGRNRFHFYDPEHDRQICARRKSVLGVAQALERGEFVLHYQPKVNLCSGAIAGMEALIRWQHPERGLLPPAEFLPWIEGTELDVPIGNWVLDAALRQIADWKSTGVDLAVSVNVSAQQLQKPDFAIRLGQTLARYPNVPHGALSLEILESAAIGDLKHAAHTLNACLAHGTPIALDDFGTGYSSLTYFRKLPISQLKIDRSFVRDMLIDSDDLQIIQSVARLADAFHCEVIAEGAESDAHCQALLDLGCCLVQGFGIARPMPAAAVPGWVGQWQAEWPTQKRWLPVPGDA
ncbi:MAG: EAL domain-containing protein [Rhodocyclaceae bacterium]